MEKQFQQQINCQIKGFLDYSNAYLASLNMQNHSALHNDFAKHLSEPRSAEKNKKASLYEKFSTIEQISKALEIQKRNFDQQINLLNDRINASISLLTKAKTSNKQLLQKITDFNLNLQRSFRPEDTGFDPEFQRIPLNQITYHLRQKSPFDKVAKNDDLFYFEKQIQKAEKQCAKMYLLQNEKFTTLSVDLQTEFDKIEKQVTKWKKDEEGKGPIHNIIMEEQSLKGKIRSWEKTLNDKFSSKMLNLIKRVESSI